MYIHQFHPHEDHSQIKHKELISHLVIKPEDNISEIAEFKRYFPEMRLVLAITSEEIERLVKYDLGENDLVELLYDASSINILDSFPARDFILDFSRKSDLTNFIDFGACPLNLKYHRYTPKLKNWNENLELKILLQRLSDSKNILCWGTGEIGLISRVLAQTWGSCLCPFPSQEERTNYNFSEDLSDYIFNAPEKFDHVFGIAGNPVKHSLSPLIHNYLFSQNSINAIYLPFAVDDFEEFFSFAKLIQISGLSVTTPHKEKAYNNSNNCCSLSEKVEAANTLKFSGNSYNCLNTDGPGYYDSLKNRIVVEGGNILILGAGGAGRPIISHLVSRGANVYLTGRNANRICDAAIKLGCNIWEGNEGKIKLDVIINTTPVAHSNEDVSGFLAGLIPGGCIASDLHYNPPKPYFLDQAEQMGCELINGLDMLLYQALRQFDYWFPGVNVVTFAELKNHILSLY